MILLAIAGLGFLFWTKPGTKVEIQPDPLVMEVAVQAAEIDMHPGLAMMGKWQAELYANWCFELGENLS